MVVAETIHDIKNIDDNEAATIAIEYLAPSLCEDFQDDPCFQQYSLSWGYSAEVQEGDDWSASSRSVKNTEEMKRERSINADTLEDKETKEVKEKKHWCREVNGKRSSQFVFEYNNALPPILTVDYNPQYSCMDCDISKTTVTTNELTTVEDPLLLSFTNNGANIWQDARKKTKKKRKERRKVLYIQGGKRTTMLWQNG